MAYRMDYFRGTESQVLENLGSKIKYPAFAIVRDENESDSCRLAFVNQSNELEYIRGFNESNSESSAEKQIVNTDKLPPESEGKLDVLYIVGEDVYLFNGTAYKCINEMDTSELEALTERVAALETAIADKVSAEEVDAKVEAKVEESVTAVVDEKVNAKVDEVIDEKVNTSVDNSEKIIALEASNQELTTKVSELEEAIAALEENSAPSFIELE